MIFFLNAIEVDDEGLPTAVTQAKLSRYTVDFITSMRATVVSLGMYPPGSKTISNAVEKVSNNLQNVLESQGSITFSEVNGLLLADGQQLDERDRTKAPVVDFIMSLIERKIQSLTFTKKVSPEELVAFLVIMSKRPKELKELGPIPDQMKEQNITNIQLNERIYVATTQEERDELEQREKLLSKLLADDPRAMDDIDVDELLVDKEQFSNALKRLAIGDDDKENTQEGIEKKAQQIQQMLDRSFMMLDNIKDEAQRAIFKEGLADMVSSLRPEVITRLYLDEARTPTAFTKLGIDKLVFDRMEGDKVKAVTRGVINEVQTIKRDMASMSPEERQARVNAIKSVVKILINNTMTREFFSEITELLRRAKLVKDQVAEQLEAQAEAARSQAVAPAAGAAASGLIESDGSVNREALEKTIRFFDRIPAQRLPAILSGLTEVIGEVVFHEKVEHMVTNALERIDAERDYSAVYIALADFLERICQELVFNENYKIAERIVDMFNQHANPNNERHHEQKKRAIVAQEKIASDDINRMLLTVIQHGDENARAAVGDLLTKMGNRMMLALMDLLKTTEDRSLRRTILNLLQQMGAAILDPVIAELRNSSNPWYVIRNMVLLLSGVGNQAHVDLLQALLAHDEARVRKETIAAIAKLDPQNARETIRDLLNDKNMVVRRFVIGMLGTMRDHESIPALAALVAKRNIAQQEEEEPLQLDAITALGKMNHPDVVPFLLDALKKEGIFSKKRTKTPEIRSRAVFALANYPSDEVKKSLKAAAKDGNDNVSEAAKAILARMG
jgi:HEAT repeat protein